MGVYEHQGSIVIMFVPADITLDAVVNIADAIFLLGYLFQSEPQELPCEAAANVNGDAAVNVADVIYLLSFLFSNGPPPPLPYPDCGYPPDPSLPCGIPGACP